MPDIAQMTSDLRAVPDQTLQSELANPSGLVPSYLVLAEAQRRQLMRQAAQKQQSQGQSSTVMQDVVRNMTAQQPPQGGPPAPAGMTPPQQGQGQPMPGAAPPNQMRMAAGGPLPLADGGDPEDDDDETTDTGAPTGGWKGDPSEPIVEMPVRGPSVMRPSDVDGWVSQYSTKYGVDPNLARAIMHQESRGNESARSGKGAVGLFQLMPATAKDLGVDPHDPEQNVEGGIRYFRNMLDRYGGDIPTALAAYNAGPGAVDRFGGVPPFRETTNYVAKVQDRYDQLNRSSPATGAIQMAPPAPGQLTQEPTPAAQQPPPPAASNEGVQLPQPTTFMNAPPQSVEQPVAAPGQPTFAVDSHPGRIHQMIDDQQKIIDDIRSRISQLPDPYGQQNIDSMRRIAPAIYGVPSNYLDDLSRRADVRAASISQLQQQILSRYQNPNPWEFLGNIAAGMGASKQLSLPLMLGQGVGLAWQRQDEEQQRAMQDFDALEKMREGIYSNVEGERARMGQTLTGLLEHQAGVTESNRKVMEDQLTRATTEQDRLKKMLIPSSKLEAFYNPQDYDQDQRDLAAQAMKQLHPDWNKGRMDEEANAIQLLHSLGDPYVPNGDYASARDQVIAKHPDMASQVAKPAAPAAQPLDPKSNLIHTTYLSGRQYVDGRNYKGKMADQIQAQVDATPGITYLGKDQAESLDNIEDAQRGFDSMERSMLGYLPKDATGHIIASYLTVPLSQWAQLKPALAAWGAWRAQAIAQLRAAAGSKGLRINEAEIRNAVENDVPKPDDTVGTAMTRLAIMRRIIQNQEASLFHDRGKTDPAPQIPMLSPDGMTVGYIPADQRDRALQQGYKLVQ